MTLEKIGIAIIFPRPLTSVQNLPKNTERMRGEAKF